MMISACVGRDELLIGMSFVYYNFYSTNTYFINK